MARESELIIVSAHQLTIVVILNVCILGIIELLFHADYYHTSIILNIDIGAID